MVGAFSLVQWEIMKTIVWWKITFHDFSLYKYEDPSPTTLAYLGSYAKLLQGITPLRKSLLEHMR